MGTPCYVYSSRTILENFDIKKMGLNSADYIHMWIEANKLAHADRHQFYGDPDFVEVPIKEPNIAAKLSATSACFMRGRLPSLSRKPAR